VRYGLPLVEACARSGTHYADLTGETLFMRESIDRYDESARTSGARIVHGAGFDSIPSDLGVLLLHEAVRAAGAGELGDTSLVVTGMRGGFSGGTIASMREMFNDLEADPSRRRVVNDPYALSPQRDKEPQLGSERDLQSIVRDGDTGEWLAPFVMAQVNTRVVRRSNALQDWAYGRSFRYREVMSGGAGPAVLPRQLPSRPGSECSPAAWRSSRHARCCRVRCRSRVRVRRRRRGPRATSASRFARRQRQAPGMSRRLRQKVIRAMPPLR
jgi:short subunit dehydrogenase-like uncharacterized protein